MTYKPVFMVAVLAVVFGVVSNSFAAVSGASMVLASVVPEPASLSLLAIGGAVLLLRRRR